MIETRCRPLQYTEERREKGEEDGERRTLREGGGVTEDDMIRGKYEKDADRVRGNRGDGREVRRGDTDRQKRRQDGGGERGEA